MSAVLDQWPAFQNLEPTLPTKQLDTTVNLPFIVLLLHPVNGRTS